MARAFDLLSFAYAHRGLWSANGPQENSLSAFKAAAAAGVGIEIDVRPSSDGQPFIFHDPLLHRLTDRQDVFESCPASELSRLTLVGTDDRLPHLNDLLGIWPAGLPILVEMKIDGGTDPGTFARTVCAHMDSFNGLAALMSFSEEAVRAVPDTFMRGQLTGPSNLARVGLAEETARRAAEDGIDYLALHISDTDTGLATACDPALPRVFWTGTSAEDVARAHSVPGAIIFENIDPALASPRCIS